MNRSFLNSLESLKFDWPKWARKEQLAPPELKYRWNIQTINGSGQSGFSSDLYFTVNTGSGSPPPTPTALSPGTSTDTGFTVNTTTPTMQWSGSNATTYARLGGLHHRYAQAA